MWWRPTPMWGQACPDTCARLRPTNIDDSLPLCHSYAALLCLGLSIVMFSQQLRGHISHGFGLPWTPQGWLETDHTHGFTHTCGCFHVCTRAHRRINPNAGLHTHHITHLITQTLTLIHSNNVSHTHTLRGPSVSLEEGTSGWEEGGQRIVSEEEPVKHSTDG